MESWVHKRIGGIRDAKSRKELDRGYVKRATQYLLDLLDRYDRKVTFFVVSEIWDWFPDLVERIKHNGHEIAYHTHTHRRIEEAHDLLEELRLSESFMEEFKPVGFRAPEALIKTAHLRILAEYGFTYDSSSYANLGASSVIYGVREIPISTFGLLKSSNDRNLPRNMRRGLMCGELPLGSGFFFSALAPASRFLISVLSLQNDIPVLFIHPWQIMPPDAVLSAPDYNLPRQVAMLLYSRSCLGPFLYLLSHSQTVLVKDLALHVK